MMLETKKYNMWDYMRLSMKICPIYTLLRLANHLVNALIPTAQVLVIARFVDTALAIFGGTVPRSAILVPLALLIGLIAYQNVIGKLMVFANRKYDFRLEEAFRAAVVDKRARLEYRHIEDNDTWELIQRIGTNPGQKISEGQYNLMEQTATIVRIVSLLSLVMTQVWWAGLVILAACIPLAFLAAKSGKQVYESQKESQKHNRRAGYYQGLLLGRDNVEERALFAYSRQINDRWYEKYDIARRIDLKAYGLRLLKIKGSGLITLMFSLLIVGVLILPLSSGALSVGTFMGLSTATFDLVQTMTWKLNYNLSLLAQHREYLKDLTAFCALSEQEGVLELPAEPAPVFETLEFRYVTFAYPGTDKEILKDFCLTLKRGIHYAFVGVNGAGKTTVTKLLTGLYTNYEGEILLNGKELRTYSPAELKALFSVVYQDFSRYYLPVKESIGLGNVRHMENTEAVGRAVEAIGLSEAVDKLPQGLDTWLGKIKTDGTDLSGGEWQRVAIARSLVSPAQIRILDEPTAALDPVAESRVYETFGRISQGKSTIFITHRLGAAKLADVIVVIDGGRAAEQGSHQELMDRGGLYAAMFDSQRSWYQ